MTDKAEIYKTEKADVALNVVEFGHFSGSSSPHFHLYVVGRVPKTRVFLGLRARNFESAELPTAKPVVC